LFIVTYSYVGVARNWSHKRRTNPQRPKIETETREQSCTSWGAAGLRGAAPEANAFWAWTPLIMHIGLLNINLITFIAQIYNALHMQGKKGDFWYLGSMALLPPPKSAYELKQQTRSFCCWFLKMCIYI